MRRTSTPIIFALIAGTLAACRAGACARPGPDRITAAPVPPRAQAATSSRPTPDGAATSARREPPSIPEELSRICLIEARCAGADGSLRRERAHLLFALGHESTPYCDGPVSPDGDPSCACAIGSYVDDGGPRGTRARAAALSSIDAAIPGVDHCGPRDGRFRYRWVCEQYAPSSGGRVDRRERFTLLDDGTEQWLVTRFGPTGAIREELGDCDGGHH
jgi:hypothetical protein